MTLLFVLALSACSSSGSSGECRNDEGCDAPLVCDRTEGPGRCVCTPGGCLTGFNCDEETQLCVENCVDDNDCTAGLFCNVVSGKCVMDEPDCTLVDQCDADEICNADTRTCVPSCLAAGGACAVAGEVCDPGTGLCVEGCSATGCTEDEVCGPQGLCIGRCGAGGTVACSAAEACDPLSRLCEPRCSGQDDCGADQVCDADGVGLCVGCFNTRMHCNYAEFCAAETATCVEVDEDCGGDSIARPDGQPWTRNAGPIAWTVDTQVEADMGGCAQLVTVTAAYYDLQADFPDTPGGRLNQAVSFLPSSGATAVAPFRAPQLGEGSSAAEGTISFGLCDPEPAEGAFQYYLKDTNGNFGNVACFSLAPPAMP